MPKHINLWIDRSAIGLSGLCLLHCMFGMVALALLSASSSAFFGHDIHKTGLAIALPLAILGLVAGAMKHRRRGALALGAVGLLAMSVALMMPHGAPELVLTIVGVVLVAAAHWFNMRWTHAH